MSTDTQLLLSSADESRQRRYSNPDVGDCSNVSESSEGIGDEKSGLVGAIFNLIKSIVGAGLLGAPFAVLQCGIGLGTLVLVGVAIITDYSLRVLLAAALAADETTYQGVVRNGFGFIGYAVVTFMQTGFPFLGMVSYNIIIGDTMTKVIRQLGGAALQGTVVTNRLFVIFLATICITLPLSMYRNISKYAKFSGFSLIVIVFTVIFVYMRLDSMTTDGKVPSGAGDWDFANLEFAGGISIFATAYICHHNSFLVFNSMRQQTERAWDFVVHCSLAVVVVIMVLFSIGAYATFRQFTEGDIFENYCSYDDFANVARAIYAINILLTYPIQCFVVREVIENTFWFKESAPSMARHVMLTLAICSSACAIAMGTDCVNIVMQINGVLTAIPLIFIMPAICYLKHCGTKPLYSWSNSPAILTAVAGFLLCVLGTFQVVMHFIAGIECSKGRDLEYCFPSVSNDSAVFNVTKVLPHEGFEHMTVYHG